MDFNRPTSVGTSFQKVLAEFELRQWFNLMPGPDTIVVPTNPDTASPPALRKRMRDANDAPPRDRARTAMTEHQPQNGQPGGVK